MSAEQLLLIEEGCPDQLTIDYEDTEANVDPVSKEEIGKFILDAWQEAQVQGLNQIKNYCNKIY